MLNVDCTTLHPPKAGEPLPKFRKLAIPFLVVVGGFQQHAHPPHAVGRLLRACRKRPSRRRATDKCDEFASPHRPTPQIEGLTLPCCGLHCGITANSGCQCPLWVKSRHWRAVASCPLLYPQKRT